MWNPCRIGRDERVPLCKAEAPGGFMADPPRTRKPRDEVRTNPLAVESRPRFEVGRRWQIVNLAATMLPGTRGLRLLDEEHVSLANVERLSDDGPPGGGRGDR